jgi:hypothetical protein
MFRNLSRILYIVTMLCLVQTMTAQTIEIQLQSNKAEYITGEPVLLKTKVLNASNKDFIGNSPGYGWGKEFGFTMYIAYGEEDFENILSVQTKILLGVSTPPLHLEYFHDRHWLPKSFAANQEAERLDMLVFPKTGKYRLKSVMKEPDGKIRASKPAQFTVLPPEDKADNISQLGNQALFLRLGRAIHKAYYEEIDESLTSDEAVKQLSSMIVEKYPDSTFSEYINYSHILSYSQIQTEPRELAKGRMGLAERFVKEHPNSWLLPEFYRKLFWTYVSQGDLEKAEQVRNKAMQEAPHAAVLRYVKEVGPTRLNEMRQVSTEIVATRSRPSLLIGILVVGGIVIAAFILLLKKKPTSPGK